MKLQAQHRKSDFLRIGDIERVGEALASTLIEWFI